MNPAAHAEFAVLETRVDVLEEREKSTRRRVEENEVELRDAIREQAKALTSIQLDVHEIRSGKKSLVRLARAAVVVLTLTGAGFVIVARWTIDHWLKDMQTQHDPSLHRRIP